MSTKKETPEKERARLVQKEQQKNPAGNFNDHVNRTQSGMPTTTGMSVKEIGLLILMILVVFIGYSIYKLF